MTTIIEWHDAKTELPEESGEYIVNTIGNCLQVLHYSSVHKLFNAYDNSEKECAEAFAIHAKRWAKCPVFEDTSDVVNEVLNNG